MTLGFSDAPRLLRLRQELCTWELYQVQIDKFHVMFWFENGHCLLNVAYRFDVRAADGSLAYTYDVQAPGGRKFLNVDTILRQRVVEVTSPSESLLVLAFENGDALTVHDNPRMRSAWFYRYDPENHDRPLLWAEDDLEWDEDHQSAIEW
jgi:hypothetical protein